MVAGSTDNTIGGTSAGDRNIISGNTAYGVQIIDSGTTGNVLKNNFIGVDITGETAFPNARDGVRVTGGATGNFIGDVTGSTFNVISGNGNFACRDHRHGHFNNRVISNIIGLDANGNTALGNAGYGVAVENGATNNTIGGTTAANRNIISGNITYGVNIADSGTFGNVVEGNFIGTDISSTTTFGSDGNSLGSVRRSEHHRWSYRQHGRRHDDGGTQRHFR